MAYPTIGEEGSVVSWGSANFYSALLSNFTPMGYTITTLAQPQEVTPYGATAKTHISGLGEWTVQIRGRMFSTPRLANQAFFSWGSGSNYAVSPRAWDLTITAPEYPITPMAGTTPTWKTFRPGIASWRGKLTCLADSATAGQTPNLPPTTGTQAAYANAVFKFGEESAGTDHTLTGAGVVVGVNDNVTVGDLSGYELDIMGSGVLTAAGSSGPFGTTAFGIPTWTAGGSVAGALVLASLTGSRTRTGTDSFWTSINIRCTLENLIEITLGVRGSGSLTAA